jgi:two-component system response regulator HydG
MKNILVVDDDSTFCLMLQSYLTKYGFSVTTTGNVDTALDIIKKSEMDLILSDYRMPGKDGMEMLEAIKKTDPGLPLILMTSYGDIRLAVRAMKLGAYDYITKPVNPTELLELVKAALNSTSADNLPQSKPGQKEDTPVAKPRKKLADDNGFVHGVSNNWKKISEHIDIVGPTDMSVIIEGESGTGKEFVARRLHDLSARSRQQFVAIDCGALSNEIAASEFFGHVKGSFTGAVNDKKGQFEEAQGGTIFLDEIGNLSYEIQVMLLRAIQERKIRRVGGNKDIPVDIRIIVATNDDLVKNVKTGSFREDLYHRLNEFKITVNPLRDRRDDVAVFATRFLEMANDELNKSVIGFDDDVLQKFYEYPWTGNLRELKNVIKRSVLLAKGSKVNINCLPQEILSTHNESENIISHQHDTVDLKVLSEQIEKVKIIEALEKSKYNKSKAAKLLNIDRKTLYNKIKMYQLD